MQVIQMETNQVQLLACSKDNCEYLFVYDYDEETGVMQINTTKELNQDPKVYSFIHQSRSEQSVLVELYDGYGLMRFDNY